MRTLTVLLLTLICAAASAQSPTLRVFFIDVEGGQSTLFVTPAGKSLLIDTGWPGHDGRDADRIVATAKRAGLDHLDYVLITHYHTDHVGGVPQLLARMPVSTFIDHGALTEPDHGITQHGYDDYLKALATSHARRLIFHAGDHFNLDGLLFTAVSAGGQLIPTPLPGAGHPNSACEASPLHSPDAADAEQQENVSSLGLVLTWGSTRILDLGDLTWDKERDLMCPLNKLGAIDILIVSHHGWDHSSSPALIDAIGARVAIMDNGASKGGSPLTFKTLAAAPSKPELWQLHYADAAGPLNRPAAYIANGPGADHGLGIELEVTRGHTWHISKASAASQPQSTMPASPR